MVDACDTTPAAHRRCCLRRAPWPGGGPDGARSRPAPTRRWIQWRRRRRCCGQEAGTSDHFIFAMPNAGSAWTSETKHRLAQGEHGQRGKHAVDAIEDAAVAGDEMAGILDPRMALEQAFVEVA